MRYHERLNIIYMRDNGPRHSIRIRRSRLYLLIIFLTSMPFLCLLLAVQCWLLWSENVSLRENVDRFESDYQAAEARAERLETLEELLREENVQGREVLLRNLARDGEEVHAQAEETEEPKPMPEGPGHEEYPALDTGRVNVSNVQARAIQGNSLRIGLNLTNPENEQVLSGEVRATLMTSDGGQYKLVFVPEGVGNFRINRFKRAVMVAKLPRGCNPENGEVVVEVIDDAGTPIYRNIFAVQSK